MNCACAPWKRYVLTYTPPFRSIKRPPLDECVCCGVGSMEMPAAPGGGVRGPYVRGYYRLPQEDSPGARTWDNSHCQETRLESSSQSAPPPYTPSPQSSPHYSPDSQYSPAPHTLPPPAPPSAPDFFISQQQSSNVRYHAINITQTSYSSIDM